MTTPFPRPPLAELRSALEGMPHTAGEFLPKTMTRALNNEHEDLETIDVPLPEPWGPFLYAGLSISTMPNDGSRTDIVDLILWCNFKQWDRQEPMYHAVVEYNETAVVNIGGAKKLGALSCKSFEHGQDSPDWIDACYNFDEPEGTPQERALDEKLVLLTGSQVLKVLGILNERFRAGGVDSIIQQDTTV